MTAPSRQKTLYAIFGNPINHSISPVIHNAALKNAKINGIYAAFKTETAQDAVKMIKELDIAGASITIPHKTDIIKYIDKIGETAKEIGAVNTVINENGLLFGTNTDAGGAIKALLQHTEIENKNIAILGAGGAARAVIYGVNFKKGKVTLLNRTVDKGEKLAKEFNVNFMPLSEINSEIKKHKFEIIINTTSLGMKGCEDQSPIKKESLNKDIIVMDIIYNPLKTKLLKYAEEKGCKTINGVSMLVYQAALQFELFVGIQAPIDIMKKAAEAALPAS
ncbi:MAG: shikimate dehydrogenase [Deltaproteobacteria bacterium]|nr:shikimate dehydrogenase [Deltaproteobacteria bacterium]